MKEIRITAEAAKTVPAFIRDVEKRRKEAEQATNKRYAVSLNLTCDK